MLDAVDGPGAGGGLTAGPTEAFLVDAERGSWVLVVVVAFAVLLWQASREKAAAARTTSQLLDTLFTPEGVFWSLVVVYAVATVASRAAPPVAVPPSRLPTIFPLEVPPRPPTEVRPPTVEVRPPAAEVRPEVTPARPEETVRAEITPPPEPRVLA